MAENKQEPRQLKKPGHKDGQTDTQTGSERRVSERDGEKVRQGEDKLAVAKWRMGALCETSEVEGKMEALKGYSSDLAPHFDKV